MTRQARFVLIGHLHLKDLFLVQMNTLNILKKSMAVLLLLRLWEDQKKSCLSRLYYECNVMRTYII